MGQTTEISWTDATWTPIRARVREDAAEIARAKGYASLEQIAGQMAGHVGPHCEHCSPGCENCYSEAGNGRCLPANGTGLPFDRRVRDLVEIFVDENILEQPLHWRKARKIFVCSQTDLFAEFVTDEMVDRVFTMMGRCRQHTFQVLTKRPERMREYIAAFKPSPRGDGFITRGGVHHSESPAGAPISSPDRWPLPNIWLGVSVEDQQRADERIPELLATPAAVRFLSVEPMLGPVDLSANRIPAMWSGGLHWVIVGGESGHGARPCDIAWIRSIVAQCKAAGVACFVKQVGAKPFYGNWELDAADGTVGLRDRKGGDMSEWPEDLRVREMPEVSR